MSVVTIEGQNGVGRPDVIAALTDDGPRGGHAEAARATLTRAGSIREVGSWRLAFPTAARNQIYNQRRQSGWRPALI
jgi:hypothetical protein